MMLLLQPAVLLLLRWRLPTLLLSLWQYLLLLVLLLRLRTLLVLRPAVRLKTSSMPSLSGTNSVRCTAVLCAAGPS
jgi:hypothetical protein